MSNNYCFNRVTKICNFIGILIYLFFIGDHLTEKYRLLNPFKKVPFIDDNGTVLMERLGINITYIQGS